MTMRSLFIKAAVFIVLLALVNIAFIRWTGDLLNRASFELPSWTTTLVLGDSQVECAIDPSELPGVISVAQGGEAFLFAYAKARRFIAENPQLDTIWLSFNYMALERKQDTLTRSERYINYKLPFNFFLLDATDLRHFAQSPHTYASLLQTPFKRRAYIGKALRNTTNWKDLNFGGYLKLTDRKLEQDVARRAADRQEGRVRLPEFGTAADQVEYLDRIITLCASNDITCILVNTPVHHAVQADTDTTAYYAFLRSHYPRTPLWDHSSWTFPDSCFRDAAHLNTAGAKLYAERLKTLRSSSWPPTDRKGNPMEVN
jgi:hypothetical protein